MFCRFIPTFHNKTVYGNFTCFGLKNWNPNMLEDVFEESDDSVGDSIESLSYSLENAVPQQEVLKVFPIFFSFFSSFGGFVCEGQQEFIIWNTCRFYSRLGCLVSPHSFNLSRQLKLFQYVVKEIATLTPLVFY